MCVQELPCTGMSKTKHCTKIEKGDSRNVRNDLKNNHGEKKLATRKSQDKKLTGSQVNIIIVMFLRGIDCFYRLEPLLENLILEFFPKYKAKENFLEFKECINTGTHAQMQGQIQEIHDERPNVCNESTRTLDERQAKIIALTQQLKRKDKLISTLEKQKERIIEENLSLENERQKWKEKFQKMENDYKDILFEFGRLSVENDSNKNKGKETEKFQKIFHPKLSTSLVANTEGNMSPPFGPKLIITSNAEPHSAQTKAAASLSPVFTQSPSESREQTVGAGAKLADFTPCPEDHYQNDRDQNSSNATYESNVSSENMPLSVQVEDRSNVEPISLINMPSCSIAAQVYNAYKLLLSTISNLLLSSDIIKIRKWATENFEVQNNCSLTEMFSQLDHKGAINAFDLGQLRAFFESIGRFDLVYLIDEFSSDDYDKFKKLISENYRRNSSHEHAGNQVQVASSRVQLPHNRNSLRATAVDQAVSNVGRLERQTSAPQNDEIPIASNHARMTNVCSDLPSISSSNVTGNRCSTRGNSEIVPDGSAVNNTRGVSTQRNASDEQGMGACCNTPMKNGNMKENKMSPSRQQSSPNSSTQSNSPSQHRSSNYLRTSSHGKKQEKWLCNHYKRKCMVKFECCNKYWPCHRCHNEQSTCGRRKLKSRDTTMIKCIECGKEQKFGKFCVSCNTQFSTFYCGLCKHLTGNDDHPYHCDKCGICRIHGDRSYHCDVCGICLDVQLRGSHKCRPNSAHDECCICLEDAFTGCQILPCSHKVHKDCATRMIRSGITRCPVCRESFAHKLERRRTTK